MTPRTDEHKRDWRADRPADRPVSDEPRSLIDSWPFLITFGLICIGILIARSQGVI